MKKIIIGLLVLFSLTANAQFSGGTVGSTSQVALTYGRVNAINDLANVTYTNANNGVKIPFSNTIYSSGVSYSGTDVMIPSVNGRYRISWLMQASSGEFAGNGFIVVVQNNAVVGRVFYDMMEAAGVNHCSGFIDADLTGGLGVELRYQTSGTSDAVIWQIGSYFDLTQISGLLPVTGQTVDYKTVSAWNVSNISANIDAVFTSIGAGNIPYSAGLFTLTAGKTYEISAHLEGTLTGNTSGDYAQFILCDASNTQLPNSPSAIIVGTANTSNWQNSSSVSTIFTPTVTTQVKLRLSNRGGASTFSTNSGLQSGIGCWMTVRQVGTTGFSTLPIANGGTGSSTQNFVDLTTNQNIAGVKNFTSNVGIGTTTPNAALQLGNVVTNRKIVLWETVNNDNQFFGLGINNSMLRYQIDGPLSTHAFYAGASATTSNELMRVQGNGNVGIGISTPTSKLTVSGSFSLPFTNTGVADLTVTAAMYTINANNFGGGVTVTLPNPIGIPGRIYVIKRDQGSTANVNITTAGGALVQNTAGSFVTTYNLAALGSYGQSVMLQSDNLNWHRLN